MKKYAALLLAMILVTMMVFTLASCGETADNGKDTEKVTQSEQTTKPSESENNDNPTAGNETEDDENETDPTSETEDLNQVSHNVPKALSFKTQDDLKCKNNFVFAARYTGSDANKEDDSLFFDFFDEDALYAVFTGFNEDDGEINGVWGYGRLYHFYNDKASYDAAIAKVPSYLLKEQNPECLYFTTGNVRDPGASSYSEMMAMYANKETDGGEFNNFVPHQ